MKKIILIIICFFLLLIGPSFVVAQESVLTNPFVPQLPKKVEPVEEPLVLESSNNVDVYRVRVDEALREEKEINLPLLKVSGLIWNTTRPQAIVNEQVVGIGDSVEDVKIVSIQKTGLEVEYMGKSFTISP